MCGSKSTSNIQICSGVIEKDQDRQEGCDDHSAVSSEQREEALRSNFISRCTGSQGSGQRTRVSAGIAKELIVSEKATTILYLQEKCEKITEALVEACQATRIEDLVIIETLDGVKNILGSSFLAEMGELSNFKSYNSLIAYMGLDPSTHQSGKHVGPSKISKRFFLTLPRISGHTG